MYFLKWWPPNLMLVSPQITPITICACQPDNASMTRAALADIKPSPRTCSWKKAGDMEWLHLFLRNVRHWDAVRKNSEPQTSDKILAFFAYLMPSRGHRKFLDLYSFCRARDVSLAGIMVTFSRRECVEVVWGGAPKRTRSEMC